MLIRSHNAWLLLLVACFRPAAISAGASGSTPTPFDAAWPNSLAVCAIMAGERTADVREWIEYHRFVGVDHIYLYDNGNEGGGQAREVSDYIHAGFLTYIVTTGEVKQKPAYKHCLEQNARAYSWLAFLDIDEFLTVTDPQMASLPQGERLKGVLAEFRYRPGIMIPWKTFGPSEHFERPSPGGPLAHYDQCLVPSHFYEEVRHRNYDSVAARTLGVNESQVALLLTQPRYGKSVVNTFWASAVSSPHGFWYRGFGLPVTDNGTGIPMQFSEKRQNFRRAAMSLLMQDLIRSEKQSRLYINHYLTRSHEDFANKLKRGEANFMPGQTFRTTATLQFLEMHQERHEFCSGGASLVDECCRRDGKPWPPPPEGPTAADNATVLDIGELPAWQAKWDALRPPPTGKNPFAANWTADVLMCTVVGPNVHIPSLLEWLQRHWILGVRNMKVYFLRSLDQYELDMAEVEAETSDAPAQDIPSILHVVHQQKFAASVAVEALHPPDVDVMGGPEEGAQAKCMMEGQDHAFVMYLPLTEYLIVRDKAGRVTTAQWEGPDTTGAHRPFVNLLSEDVFRYAPGIAVPRFEGPPATPHNSAFAPPGRRAAAKKCKPPITGVRGIANSFWVDETSFRFRGDLMPVDDLGETYVPAGPPGSAGAVARNALDVGSRHNLELPECPESGHRTTWGSRIAVFTLHGSSSIGEGVSSNGFSSRLGGIRQALGAAGESPRARSLARALLQ